MSTESFIDYFRARHGWRCRAGSAISRDLTNFASDQASSSHRLEDLYVLFCMAHGLRPKDAAHSILDEHL